MCEHVEFLRKCITLFYWPVNYCSMATTCIHDNRMICASTPDGCRRRTFLDQCDMYEFNCDYNTRYHETCILHCMSPDLETKVTTTSIAGETPENFRFIEENMIETLTNPITCVSTRSTTALCKCLTNTSPVLNTRNSTTTSTVATTTSSSTVTTTSTFQSTTTSSGTTATSMTPTRMNITLLTTTSATSEAESTSFNLTAVTTNTTAKPTTETTDTEEVTELTTLDLKRETTSAATPASTATTACLNYDRTKTWDTPTKKNISYIYETFLSSVSTTNTSMMTANKTSTDCVSCQRPKTWETTTEKEIPYTLEPTSSTTIILKTTIKQSPRISEFKTIAEFNTNNNGALMPSAESRLEVTTKPHFHIESITNSEEPSKLAPPVKTTSDITDTLSTKTMPAIAFIPCIETTLYIETTAHKNTEPETSAQLEVITNSEELHEQAPDFVPDDLSPKIIFVEKSDPNLINRQVLKIKKSTSKLWYPSLCKSKDCERPDTWLTTKNRQRRLLRLRKH